MFQSLVSDGAIPDSSQGVALRLVRSRMEQAMIGRKRDRESLPAEGVFLIPVNPLEVKHES